MASVTLTTLLARVRERADMVGSSFVTDASTSLYSFINEGVQKLHEKLVAAYAEDYLESSGSISLVSGTSDYALPSDFLKLYGVDLPINGVTTTLKPFMKNERNQYANSSLAYRQRPSYKLSGSNIRFLPSTVTGTATIRYAPTIALLTTGTDTVNFPNGWERYVVIDAAIQVLMKEESAVADLKAERQEMERQLEELKVNRDASFPRHVTDMDAVDFSLWY